MSIFMNKALRSRPRLPLSINSISTNTRCFHVSVRRAALSESDHSERQRDAPYRIYSYVLLTSALKLDDHDDRKAKIDHHKHDQLHKQKEGKGHWKTELSSNSEAAIKADRDEISNVEEDISKLMKETEEAIAEKRKK
ncbi:MAG: hypothetical protein Q9219_005593 [cf. Caloplaca sp. 3 TL-2023]